MPLKTGLLLKPRNYLININETFARLSSLHGVTKQSRVPG